MYVRGPLQNKRPAYIFILFLFLVLWFYLAQVSRVSRAKQRNVIDRSIDRSERACFVVLLI